jgi:hypothetical protein
VAELAEGSRLLSGCGANHFTAGSNPALSATCIFPRAGLWYRVGLERSDAMQTNIEVRRIDLWSLFKVSFFVYALLGLIGGFFYLFFMMLASTIGSAIIEEEFPNIGLLGGAVGIVLMPVIAFLYGAIGSVTTTICGAIINVIMKASGGVKFDVDVLPVEGLMQPPVAVPPVQPPQQPTPEGPPTVPPAAPASPGQPSDT